MRGVTKLTLVEGVKKTVFIKHSELENVIYNFVPRDLDSGALETKFEIEAK